MAEGQNEKRHDYLSWEEYFMAVAFLSAERSKDPVTQVEIILIVSSTSILSKI